MVVTGSPVMRILAAIGMVLVLVSGSEAVFGGFDGLPRPAGMEGDPTSLGKTPVVKYNGNAADCTWYSWQNVHYPPEETANCSTLLWDSISTDDPSNLDAYNYYALSLPEFFDPGYNETFCVIGCFILSAASGPSMAPSSPPPSAANPPDTSAPPAAPPVSVQLPPAMPPTVDAPAVSPTPTPPPAMTPPLPATLFRPPPPGLPQSPAATVTPPSGPTQAPGPATQLSAGSSRRILSFCSLFVVAAALLLSTDLFL